MAGHRLTIKRLVEKYGFPVSGLRYSQLVGDIIQDNIVRAQKAVHGVSNRRYRKAAKQAVDEGVLKLPVFAVGIPTVRKAAESGKSITDTLRDRLTSGIREAIKGGNADPEAAIRAMMGVVNTVMEPYIRRMSPTEVPAYCKTIAVTEVRSALDLSKWTFAEKFAQDNNLKLKMSKRWVHYSMTGHKVQKPRPGHLALHGVTIPINEAFTLHGPHGAVSALYPHAPNLPVGEVINCNCTYDILVSVDDVEVRKSVEHRTEIFKDLEYEIEKWQHIQKTFYGKDGKPDSGANARASQERKIDIEVSGGIEGESGAGVDVSVEDKKKIENEYGLLNKNTKKSWKEYNRIQRLGGEKAVSLFDYVLTFGLMPEDEIDVKH